MQVGLGCLLVTHGDADLQSDTPMEGAIRAQILGCSRVGQGHSGTVLLTMSLLRLADDADDFTVLASMKFSPMRLESLNGEWSTGPITDGALAAQLATTSGDPNTVHSALRVWVCGCCCR